VREKCGGLRMGLDIGVMTNLEYIEPQPDHWPEGDDHLDPQGRDITHLTAAGFPIQMGDLKEGYYFYTDRSHFRAGSYSGYNAWRDLLAQLVYGVSAETIWNDSEGYAGKPFYELINFSDCEGVIGTVVCTRLYGDFVAHYEKAKDRYEHARQEREMKIEEMKKNYPMIVGMSHEHYFLDTYEEFMNAFETAARDNGALQFC
jgi:hypothetical protein